ncbi:MAG: hypothetical protein V4693_15730 [Pseudomonadota bacterium]
MKSTIALMLAATLVACGGNNPSYQLSGPQTQQPPGTKGAPTDTPVQPESGADTTTAIKALG